MALPEQLLLSDLLRRKVRCDQGLDHGGGVCGWMHPPVHRLLGWVSRPSALSRRRLVWRLDQLRGLGELEVFVQGSGAETEPSVLERLPTLIGAALIGADGEPLGMVSDAAVELASGRIRHYLASRSDPRLPGSSRWRLSPERIVDQQPGRVVTALQGLDDLPLARASVRQEFLRRSRRWREQMGEETGRLRDRFQQASGRFEERLEGWLEEPPWDGLESPLGRPPTPWDEEDADEIRAASRRRSSLGALDSETFESETLDSEELDAEQFGADPLDSDPLEDWSAEEFSPQAGARQPWPEPRSSRDAPGRRRPRRSDPRPDRFRGRDDADDPWI